MQDYGKYKNLAQRRQFQFSIEDLRFSAPQNAFNAFTTPSASIHIKIEHLSSLYRALSLIDLDKLQHDS